MIDDSALEALGRMISKASRDGFTGSIQVNFSNGRIGNINKQETFRAEELKSLYI